MRILNCIVCGKEFATNSNAQKCCSNECKIKRKRQTDKKKVSNFELRCEYCGIKFIGNKNNKFCTSECRKAYCKENKQEYEHKCIVCGKLFYNRNHKSKYCSLNCSNKWINNNPRHTLICKHCGGEFKSNYHNQKFCSTICANENRSTFPLVLCKCCGKQFRAQHSHANKFCSRECFYKQTGVKHWDKVVKLNDITHIKKAKRLNLKYEKIDMLDIFERDKWICKICNEPVDKYLPYPNPMSASLDHIIPMSKGGHHTIDNVQLAHLECNKKKSNNINYVMKQLTI